jgi:hypothetical protein
MTPELQELVRESEIRRRGACCGAAGARVGEEPGHMTRAFRWRGKVEGRKR